MRRLVEMVICTLLALAVPGELLAQHRHAGIDSALAATPIAAVVPIVPFIESGRQLSVQFAASDVVTAGGQLVAVGVDVPHFGVVVARTLPQGGIDGPVLSMGAVRVGGWFAGCEHSVGGPQRVGMELIAGLGRQGSHSSTTLGVRIPMELAASGRYGSLVLTAAPAMGWGRLDLKECEDRGPGDHCGDLQVRLAFGRTRYLLAAGVRAELPRPGLSATAGLQRLLGPGQPVRMAVGVAWRFRTAAEEATGTAAP